MFIQLARRSAIRRTGRLSHSTAACPTTTSSRCAAFDKRPSATKSVRVPRSSNGRRVLGGSAVGHNGIGPYYELDGSLGGLVGRLSPGNPSTMGEFPRRPGLARSPDCETTTSRMYSSYHTSYIFSIPTHESQLTVQHSSESVPSRPRRPSRRSSRQMTLTINTLLGARIGRTG